MLYTLNNSTLSALGIEAGSILFQSGAADELVLTANHEITAAHLWAYGDTVTLRQHTNAADTTGTKIFVGRLERTLPTATPEAHSTEYTILGPWYYVENVAFRQSWVTKSDDGMGGVTVGSKIVTRSILGQDASGNRETNGAVITSALSRASAGGTRFQVGTVDPAVEHPWEEIVDMTCAEVVSRMLRWSPDCITYFDYTSSPPTLHIRKLSNLTAVDLDTADGTAGDFGDMVSSLQLYDRPDLAPAGVVIRYDITHSNNDGTFQSFQTDKHPGAIDEDSDDPKVIHFTIDLAGRRSSKTSQRIVSEAFPADLATDKAWWKDRFPWLAAWADGDITITNPLRSSVNSYAYELQEGTIPDWLDGNAEAEEVTAVITTADGKINEAVNWQCQATDKPTSTYSTVDSTAAEPVPVGLAQDYYNALNATRVEGSITLEPDLPATYNPLSKKINLTGLRTEWESMATPVQTANRDLFSDKQVLRVGWPRHLAPQDMVELLRASRRRVTVDVTSTRTTGEDKENTQGGPNGADRRASFKPREQFVVPTNPDVIGFLDEGTEAADAGSYTTFTNGLKLRVMRVGYWHAGDKKLYGYIRDIIFPAGFPVTASAETRVVIDTPTAHS